MARYTVWRRLICTLRGHHVDESSVVNGGRLRSWTCDRCNVVARIQDTRTGAFYRSFDQWWDDCYQPAPTQEGQSNG